MIATAAAFAAAAPVNPRLTGLPFTTKWDSEDYGGGPGNYKVVHHPQSGFIYVGNNRGLLEFDGATWRLKTLGDEGVVPIVVIDSRGAVWLGGANAAAVLRPDARGELQPVEVTDRLPPAARNFGRLYVGAAAPDGVYLASPTHLIFFGHDGSTRTWPAGRVNFNGLCWLDGALHASNGRVGLSRLENGTFVGVAAPPPSPNPAIADTLRLFAARRATGGAEALLLTDVGPMRWAGPGAPMVPLSAAASAAFAEDNAAAAAFLPDGRFAFSQARRGLLIIDADGAVSTLLTPAHGLPRGPIDHLATDDRGGLWLAQTSGVARLQIESRYATHGVIDSARAFLRRGERLYIAHYTGVVWRDDAKGDLHPVSGLPTGPGALVGVGDRVFCTGQFLREITADDRSVVALPQQINSLMPLRQTPGTFVAGSVLGLRLLHFDGAAWRDGGLVPGVRGSIRGTTEDADGNLWAAGYPRTGSWRVDFRAGPSLGASAEYIDDARGLSVGAGSEPGAFASLGGVIVAVRGGKLLRYDRVSGRFVAEDRIDGLPSFDRVSITRGDNDDQWWFIRSPLPQIVHVVRTAENRWRAEVLPAGPLHDFQPNGMAYDAPTRTLWIGSRGPPISIDPEWRPTQPAPPLRAAVRNVSTAAGELLWSGGGGDPVTRLRGPLTPAQTSLRFTFSAPSFLPDYRGVIRTVFRTRLEGLEDEWTSWSLTPWREFSHLPHGKFAFHVQARDTEGTESDTGTLAFAIAPPWWRTWWFIGLACAAGIAGVASVSRWYATRALKRRVQLLEAESAVERERLRLARDLHDEVGSGLGRVILFAGEAERAKADPEKLDASLARVRTSAQELVQHARAIVWAVNPQHDTLASSIERFSHYTVETLRAAGIDCEVALPEAADIPPVALGSEARHNLFLALKEAVHNCVKYSAALRAELSIAVKDSEMVVTLRDFGRGFNPGEIQGTGYGHASIAARAKVLGGRAEILSSPGQGTTVVLRVVLAGK